MISADFDGNEDGERVADFGAAGLWVWNAGEMSIHAPTLPHPVENSQAVLLAQETDGHESDDAQQDQGDDQRFFHSVLLARPQSRASIALPSDVMAGALPVQSPLGAYPGVIFETV
jgi:hypothetical protein